MDPAPSSFRQLKLFSTESPLITRLGVDFFRALPGKPGVYFFHDETGKLLYIGQSADLKARLGSYRHVTPEKNPKRTLRLIHRTHRIQWKACRSAREAIELEAALLLEHRPPFNRAGVWQGDPWWLRVETKSAVSHVSRATMGDAKPPRSEGSQPSNEARMASLPVDTEAPCTPQPAASSLHLTLLREAPEAGTTADENVIGPLPAGFRHALGSLIRCLHRLHLPDLPLTRYPHGVFAERTPLNFQLGLSGMEPDTLATCIRDYAMGKRTDILERLTALIIPSGQDMPSPLETYWQEEVKALERFARKLSKSAP